MRTMVITAGWQRAKPVVRQPGQIHQHDTITATGAVTEAKEGKLFYPVFLPHQMIQELIPLHPAIAAAVEVHHRAAAVQDR
jgi:hypothetical protein